MARDKKEAAPSPAPSSSPAAAAAAPVPVAMLKPPGLFRAFRWFFFCGTVAISIGMLAMLDQHLTELPFLYDGPQKQFYGRWVNIDYCLLSNSRDYVQNIRCQFGFATAAVSLAISMVWSYLQALRRNPFRHPNTKWTDLAISVAGLAWWIACAVILSCWTDQANKAGLPRKDWRGGLSALAWGNFLMFLGLVITSSMLATPRSQALFVRYTANKQRRKELRLQKEQTRLKKMHDDVEAQNAAETAAHQQQHAAAAKPATVAAAAAAPTAAAAAAAAAPTAKAAPAAKAASPAAAGAWADTPMRQQQQQQQGQLPVSTRAQGVAAPAAAVGDNPFRA